MKDIEQRFSKVAETKIEQYFGADSLRFFLNIKSRTVLERREEKMTYKNYSEK